MNQNQINSVINLIYNILTDLAYFESKLIYLYMHLQINSVNSLNMNKLGDLFLIY